MKKETAIEQTNGLAKCPFFNPESGFQINKIDKQVIWWIFFTQMITVRPFVGSHIIDSVETGSKK